MASGHGVKVSGRAPVKVVAYPKNYYEHANLDLHYQDKNNYSIDDQGEAKYGKKGNAPLNYVTDLQADLITLNYLNAGSADGAYGGKTERAVRRFQQHAGRVYRMPGKADVEPSEVFKGSVTGRCDHDTAQEIRQWLSNGWVLPRGRFPLTAVTNGGKLREDAAEAWTSVVELVSKEGDTVRGPYGDTTRPLRRAITSNSAGASGWSFHFCGRAIDLNQGLAGGKNMRYFLVQEPQGPKKSQRMFWRIYCKTEDQETQGTEFTKGQMTCWLPYNEKTYPIPAGRYIDLTSLVEQGGFERIAAQVGWNNTKLDKKTRQQKLEWWHFQFKKDKQPTFLDEVELIGHTEDEARAGGWKTDEDLDHKPG